MLTSDDAYGNFVELQSSYLAANGFTCEDASWDLTVAYLSDTTKVGIRSLSHYDHYLYPIIVTSWSSSVSDHCHIMIIICIRSLSHIIMIIICIQSLTLFSHHHDHHLYPICCRIWFSFAINSTYIIIT
jgi:hypothetical protein